MGHFSCIYALEAAYMCLMSQSGIPSFNSYVSPPFPSKMVPCCPSHVIDSLSCTQVALCPAHTQATSLVVAKSHRNSPISPNHKKCHCISWKKNIYVQNVAIEGLAMAGGIQGNVADSTLAALKFHEVEP